MKQSTQTDPHIGSLDLVIDWLGGHDQKKIEKTIEILFSAGQDVVTYLVLAATKRGRRPEHVCRLLDLIVQLGGPRGPDEVFELQTLLRHRDLDVRERAERVIMSISPAGAPDSPMGIAMMRAFNPFLQPPPRHRPPRRTPLTDCTAAQRGDQAAIRRRIRSIAARQKRQERE